MIIASLVIKNESAITTDYHGMCYENDSKELFSICFIDSFVNVRLNIITKCSR